ncbi:MAG TPA: glycosyltransferase family 4 protein [Cyclobacteriaceae bacterium]|nr:glycosyltransferase family 4 protein [Cyclobacteriaceae bacterium]
MSQKKVLIVTYYWPPSGGSGVQRWLKFVKYLDKAGWETFILTPDNPSFSVSDPSLSRDVPANAEVLRLPIWEPYDAFFKLSGLLGKKKPLASDLIATGKKSMFQRISGWVRGNFFIPDPRIFWIKPAVTFLNEFVKSNQIDKIITTGPPHSIHLIGLRLKKKNPGLKWIADFRDPWSEWDLLDTLSLTDYARNKHKSLEKQVLQKADRVITIAPYHVKRFESSGGRKVDLVTNGFDTDDFEQVKKVVTKKFTIRHTGIVDELRDPRPFMLALKSVVEKNSAMKDQVAVEFIGNVNSSFREFVKNDAVLAHITKFTPTIPHKDLLQLYGQTDLLLLVLAHTALAPGNLPGKLFEYLASGIPVVAIGPVDGDAADLLMKSTAGDIFSREDETGMKQMLHKHYDLWTKGGAPSTTDASMFTRKKLTDQLIGILDSL